jgi:cyclophilin family peptidyl-prolyl cis-trans isomerase
MPKTANKRAQARRTTRVQQAHRSPIERPVSRRVPLVQRAARPRGVRGFVRTYPFATTIFVLLLVGMGVLIVHNQQLGPWAPPPKPVQAKCDLTTHTCDKAPLMTINKAHYFTATVQTARGDITLQLDSQSAPIAVNNFVFLARQGFYNGVIFHRVIDGFMIQTGDPTGTGRGGPGYRFNDEPVKRRYTRGIVAMANAGPNTNGSQFFIVQGNDVGLPPNYTIFGQVSSGMDVVDKIAKAPTQPGGEGSRPVNPVRIETVTVTQI